MNAPICTSLVSVLFALGTRPDASALRSAGAVRTEGGFAVMLEAKAEGEDWAELLSSQPFIRYNRASFGGRQVDRFLRAAHLGVQEVCELDELDAIVRLVANGAGIALVPETASDRRWPAAVRSIDLGAQTFHRDIGLVHRASGSLSEPARLLAQLVRKAYETEGEGQPKAGSG